MGFESPLLYDDRPLVVIPELAKVFGLNEAIVLQQIHYWIKKNEKAGHNFKDNYYWTYNTYEEWLEQFSFWSRRTIQRTFLSLERANLIIISRHNRINIDRTKWYRLNHELIDEKVNLARSEGRLGPPNSANCPVEGAKLALSTVPVEEAKLTSPSENSKSIWNEVLKILEGQVTKSNYRTWWVDSTGISFDGDRFIVGVKNSFTAEYLKKNQLSLIERTLRGILGKAVLVDIEWNAK